MRKDLDYDKFLELTSKQSRVFFVLINQVISKGIEGKYTQLFLARLEVEAGHFEDFLDSFGALHNKLWFPVREAVAVVKSFSGSCYKTLRMIQHIPKLQMLPVEGDFHENLDKSFRLLKKALLNTAENAVTQFNKIGIDTAIPTIECSLYNDHPDIGTLSRTRKKRTIKSAEQAAVSLATGFLNIAEEYSDLKKLMKVKKSEYTSVIPDLVNETRFMLFENKFHSLQSLFDTYLAESEKLHNDKTLPSLKGHIYVIYHLLEIATICTHYLERHACYFRSSWFSSVKAPIPETQLVAMIIDVLINFSLKFGESAKKLCKETLKRYEKRGSIEVPIPNYRGFHVRPSTLIAKIVIHYGSDVAMKMDEKIYNAAIPLELFRANEVINAQKRFKIAELISSMPYVRKKNSTNLNRGELQASLRNVFISLLENHRITLYDRNFSFEDLPPIHGESLSAYAKRAITHDLAVGKIDIKSDKKVIFEGDMRVLEDLKLLADNGYGEDKFGNNIVLPPNLSYLRR